MESDHEAGRGSTRRLGAAPEESPVESGAAPCPIPPVRLRLGVDGDLELHPETPPLARQAAYSRLSGVPLQALLAARWGVAQHLLPPTRLQADVTVTEHAILRPAPQEQAGQDGHWLVLSWMPDAPVTGPAAPAPRSVPVPPDVLDWAHLTPEDALSAAGVLLREAGVAQIELTDGVSLYQLIVGDGPAPASEHHLLLGSLAEPLGRITLSVPLSVVPDTVHAAAWMLGQVCRQALLSSEVRRKEHAALRGTDLQRAVLSVVSGDAPPEAAIYAASRLVHAQAGTRVTTHYPSAIAEAYGGWLTDDLRRQVAARLIDGGDARPVFAATPADHAPVLIVPLPIQGVRRGAWVFQLSRRPWFLRPHVLDALLEAARHPVHMHGAWSPPAGIVASEERAPRSVLGLLQHLVDLDAPSAVAAQGLHYLTPVGSGAWGAYLAVRITSDDGSGGGAVILSSILRTGSDHDHPPPSAVQAVVAAFWHTVGRAGGLSLSAPHPLLGALQKRLSLAPVRAAGTGRVTGVLLVGNGPEDARTDAQLPTLLAVLAQQVGQAAERQLALRQLSRTREQTFRVLGRVLEYRSYETKGHTDRVTSMALQLGLRLDLTTDQLTVLRWGAYLHDIGKIGITDAVLHKDGPLDDRERREMHEHVIIGEALLREQDLVPEGVLEIVRSHHERWDGGGYPDGLRGDGIPLLARVFSVVDVYDALTSARTYKPSWTQEQSLSELARLSGQALDPVLTRVFSDMVRRGDLSEGAGGALLSPPGVSAD